MGKRKDPPKDEPGKPTDEQVAKMMEIADGRLVILNARMALLTDGMTEPQYAVVRLEGPVFIHRCTLAQFPQPGHVRPQDVNKPKIIVPGTPDIDPRTLKSNGDDPLPFSPVA